MAKKLLPKRSPMDNKTHGGRLLVIAGHEGMWGAAILAATAAARSGAGYVFIQSHENFPVHEHPDFLTISLKEKILEMHPAAVVLGPGMSDISLIQKKIQELHKADIKKVVLDAGAFDVLTKNPKIKLRSSWVLTPHEGELARILKVRSQDIQKNRSRYVRLASKKFDCIVLLKGHHTLIAQKENLYEIKTGNVALAKAGTGDVLSGMIGAFLAQDLAPLEAALLGAFLHGYIADEWVKEKNDHLSLMASDIIHRLPHTLFLLRK